MWKSSTIKCNHSQKNSWNHFVLINLTRKLWFFMLEKNSWKHFTVLEIPKQVQVWRFASHICSKSTWIGSSYHISCFCTGILALFRIIKNTRVIPFNRVRPWLLFSPFFTIFRKFMNSTAKSSVLGSFRPDFRPSKCHTPHPLSDVW